MQCVEQTRIVITKKYKKNDKRSKSIQNELITKRMRRMYVPWRKRNSSVQQLRICCVLMSYHRDGEEWVTVLQQIWKGIKLHPSPWALQKLYSPVLIFLLFKCFLGLIYLKKWSIIKQHILLLFDKKLRIIHPRRI